MTKTSFAFLCVGLMVVMALVLIWSDAHDKEIMQASDKYQACVQKEYGVSVAFWYAQNGEYPTCK
jgi:hypothetical protein